MAAVLIESASFDCPLRGLSFPEAGLVSKIIAIMGSMVGGYAGWWAGAFVGVMTAFFLSVVGTGLGVYAARRMAQHFGV